MSEECTHDCSSCSQNCSGRDPQSLIEKPHALSKVGKVIAVVSGKGGVGKSSVSALLATLTQRAGKQAAVLDADITGPSIPKVFGVTGRAEAGPENSILPQQTLTGIQIMSINLLLEHATDPVVWRGPIIAGTVKQFWTDVIWNDVDYMFVDMPPGTGDVPLTVFQSLPVDGIVIVSSPAELVSMIVEKAVKMADLMHIPVLGIVENMSYFECPDCGKRHKVFGDSGIDEIAKNYGITNIAKLPIDPKVARLCDDGKIEGYQGTELDEFLKKLW